jgi:hypothetical protein
MKNLSFSFLVIVLTIIQSCSTSSDSSNNQNLTLIPQAKIEHNQSNYGIYKGVFVGSSGIIILDINNSSNTVSATLIVDGNTLNFVSNQAIQANQATNINFVNGANSFTFSVSANGNNPIITNLLINGHPNAAILVVKETSTTLVKCFEGSYSGGDSGTFNGVIYGNILYGLIGNADTGIYTANGSVNNNQIEGLTQIGSTISGTLNGNSCSGTWTNNQAGMSGTWSGVRTY